MKDHHYPFERYAARRLYYVSDFIMPHCGGTKLSPYPFGSGIERRRAERNGNARTSLSILVRFCAVQSADSNYGFGPCLQGIWQGSAYPFAMKFRYCPSGLRYGSVSKS